MRSNTHNFFIILLVSFIGLFVLIPVCAHAVIFSDGQPTTYVDIDDGGESFFGGFDLTNIHNPTISGPTSMTFITRNIPRNNIFSAIGGSLGTATRQGIIQGDTNIILYNTNAFAVYGGGYSEGPDAVVTGIANISLYNSNVATVFGGGLDNGGHTGHTSVGGVNIHIDGSEVGELTGSASSVGIESQGRYAVFGDININVTNGSKIGTLMGTSDSSAHIKGSLSISIENSTVEDLHCIGHAVLDKNLSLYLGNGAVVNNLVLSIESSMGGTANFTVDGGYVNSLKFGPYSGVLKESMITMKSGHINLLDITAGTPGGILDGVDIYMQGGSVTFLRLCPSLGTSYSSQLYVTGGFIENLELGSNAGLGGIVRSAMVQMAGGTINTIYHSPGVWNSSLIFISGDESNLYNVGPGSFSNVTVQSGARTYWGTQANPFEIEAKTFDLSGTVVIPNASTVKLIVDERLILNDGTFELIAVDKNRSTPFIILDGNAGSIVDIIQPLHIDLSFPPSFIGSNGIVLATATDTLANPYMFRSKIDTGLMWGDIFFDKSSNTWYINNIQESKDYYGYSSVRSASSWLRQKQIIMAQRRSAQVLLDKKDGLWVDVQGGYEDIDVKFGKSKMPWVMASAGYDYRHNITENFAMLYGYAFGFGNGRHEWSLSNKMKNTIIMGVLDGYTGFTLNSGIYGIATVQASVSKIQTKNPGFSTNNSWTEIVPTESLELGWRYAFSDAFMLTPRAQVILEQMPKHEVNFSYGTAKENIKLKKGTTITTVAGIAATYKYFYSSVDWIKGVTGEYGAHSKFFNKTFDDKNDSNVIRASLGCGIPIKEHMTIEANIFGDVLDNKGIGGQVTFLYKF